MSKSFKGRPVFPGSTSGEALVSRQGFSTLASFYQSMLTEAETAVSSDQDNRDLLGRVLTGGILCVPKTTGSTSAGATWLTVARTGIAPKAMLLSEHIDSLAAAGLALAEVWGGRRIIAVDELGGEFLQCVRDGQFVQIGEDGTVLLR